MMARSQLDVAGWSMAVAMCQGEMLKIAGSDDSARQCSYAQAVSQGVLGMWAVGDVSHICYTARVNGTAVIKRVVLLKLDIGQFGICHSGCVVELVWNGGCAVGNAGSEEEADAAGMHKYGGGKRPREMRSEYYLYSLSICAMQWFGADGCSWFAHDACRVKAHLCSVQGLPRKQ